MNDLSDRVKREAERELFDEWFRAAVAAEKQRLLARRPLWQRIFPWVITITRRT